MSKQITRDEDQQVIHMVNTHTAYRRRKAAEEAEFMDAQMEDRRARDADFALRKERLVRSLEAAGKVTLGLGFIAAAQLELVVPWMGLALAGVCLIWAAASWMRGKA